MTPSVNLLPAEFLHEWTRVRRRQVWIVAAGLTGILAIGSYLMRLPAGRAIGQLTLRAEQAEREHQALMNDLRTAAATQAELATRLRLLVGLERYEPWPQRLATLARLLPEGVVLTLINVEPQAPEPPAARLEPGRRSAQMPNSKAGAADAVSPPKGAARLDPARPAAANGKAASANGGAATAPAAPDSPVPAMQIKGLAESQEELMTLLERLERSGLWPRVELVIASRQVSDLASATAPVETNLLAFEIRCYTPGKTP
jgi:Tfp pilus assembly protein PilN